MLIERSSEAIALADARGIVTYVSPSVTRLLGYRPDDFVGKSAFAFVHPDDLDAALAILRTLPAQSGISVSLQYRMRHRDGSWRWIDLSATNLLHDEAVEAIVGNFRDITQVKHAEAALRFLADASALLAGSLDLETTLTQVARLAVQTLASYCIVDINEPEGAGRQLVAIHADPALAASARHALVQGWAPSEQPGAPTAQALQTGRSAFYAEVTGEMLVAAARGDEGTLGVARRLRAPTWSFHWRHAASASARWRSLQPKHRAG